MGVPQIVGVRRFASIAILLIATGASMRGAADPMAKYGLVAIKPATATIYIATISMTFQPFVRHRTEFASTYSAKVFPYFFYNEKGRIWIVITDDELRRVDSGGSIDFTGHALSESGDERRVQGHVVPSGPTTGNIRVRVFVTRRISLTYYTTYVLEGAPAPEAAVTAIQAR
jgi:hypothetical protein